MFRGSIIVFKSECLCQKQRYIIRYDNAGKIYEKFRQRLFADYTRDASAAVKRQRIQYPRYASDKKHRQRAYCADRGAAARKASRKFRHKICAKQKQKRREILRRGHGYIRQKTEQKRAHRTEFIIAEQRTNARKRKQYIRLYSYLRRKFHRREHEKYYVQHRKKHCRFLFFIVFQHNAIRSGQSSANSGISIGSYESIAVLFTTALSVYSPILAAKSSAHSVSVIF